MKEKLEEQWKSEQKNILKLTTSQDELLLENVSLNNELTSTTQNIDVTPSTTSQLRAVKKEPGKKLKKILEEKNIGFDLEWSWDIQNREKVSKTSSSLGKVNLKNNANKHRRK